MYIQKYCRYDRNKTKNVPTKSYENKNWMSEFSQNILKISDLSFSLYNNLLKKSVPDWPEYGLKIIIFARAK